MGGGREAWAARDANSGAASTALSPCPRHSLEVAAADADGAFADATLLVLPLRAVPPRPPPWRPPRLGVPVPVELRHALAWCCPPQ